MRILSPLPRFVFPPHPSEEPPPIGLSGESVCLARFQALERVSLSLSLARWLGVFLAGGAPEVIRERRAVEWPIPCPTSNHVPFNSTLSIRFSNAHFWCRVTMRPMLKLEKSRGRWWRFLAAANNYIAHMNALHLNAKWLVGCERSHLLASCATRLQFFRKKSIGRRLGRMLALGVLRSRVLFRLVWLKQSPEVNY